MNHHYKRGIVENEMEITIMGNNSKESFEDACTLAVSILFSIIPILHTPKEIITRLVRALLRPSIHSGSLQLLSWSHREQNRVV